MKYKRPDNTVHGQRDHTREKEQNPVDTFFLQHALCHRKGEKQTAEQGTYGNYQHQFQGISHCLQKIFIMKHVGVIIQPDKMNVYSKHCRICKG